MGEQLNASNVDPARPARWVGLDLLRLAAIVLVLGRHMALPPVEWPVWLRAPLVSWARGGWVGVDLFFVLSGFLVSGLLFAEYRAKGTLSLRRFYVRRGWKIYPPFLVLIATTVIVQLALGATVSGRSLVAEVLFLQSYLPGLWTHTWSLGVEEHFYLLLPLVMGAILWLRPRAADPFRPTVALAGVVAVACLAMRLANAHARESFWYTTHQFPTHLRLDSLFFGVAIAYAYHFHADAFRRLLAPRRFFLIVCGVLLLAPAFILRIKLSPFVYTGGFTLFYIGSGMVLIGVLLCDLPRHRFVSALATLGAYSYSIYLWHMPVRAWLLPGLEWAFSGPLPFAVRAPLYVVASLAVGVAMARLVEVPVLRLRDRWFPQRAAQAAAAAVPPPTPVSKLTERDAAIATA